MRQLCLAVALSVAAGCSQSSSPPPDDSTSPTAEDTLAGLTSRPSEPVVLRGSELAQNLTAHAPTAIVAFARHQGAWSRIPVQVDERERVDFCQVYAKALFAPDLSPCGTTESIEFLAYSDPLTYTGADTDPSFDADDELVFMARDTGDRTSADAPDGVEASSRVEVSVSADGAVGYVYLFARTAELEDLATDYVSYALDLVPAVDYLTDYPFVGDGSCGGGVCDPPILEDSTVSTATYERHFSARWLTDGLRIFGDGSTGDNLLDVAQARFGPNLCGRHVLTFSTAEGAFVANIDGPVRAIRSYLGANSGPLTERTHVFYDQLEIVNTALRVHAIGGIMDLIDYAPTATGMSYYSSTNLGGFAIDGVPDSGFDNTLPTWELVTGPHGSLLRALTLDTSLTLSAHGYYEDNVSTPNDQCSASNTVTHPDTAAFGTSGVFVDSGGIPDTDPRHGSLDHLYFSARHFYSGSVMTTEEAASHIGRDAMVVDGGGIQSALACGDGYCSETENAVSCVVDCAVGDVGGSICGNAICEADEHELSCPQDCWDAQYVPLVACMANHCPQQKGACSDELPCVDLVTCVTECVAAGTDEQQCETQCGTSIPATSEQQQYALATWECTVASCM